MQCKESVGKNLPPKIQNTSQTKTEMNKQPYTCAIPGVFNNLLEVFKMAFGLKRITIKIIIRYSQPCF
jgi:hypothetical protein